MENFLDFFSENFSLLDGILSIFILINIFSGLRNGFVASLISFSKWVLAFIAVKFFLPILRPYADDYISSALVTDIILGIVIFFVTLFLVLLINKGLKKTLKWSGLGSIDTIFGFFFGILKGYLYFVSLFTIINFIHPIERWPNYLGKGASIDVIMWGNKTLIDVFPQRYEYLDKGRKKIDKISK